VCASTKSRSIQPFASSSCWIAFSSATFVPLRIGSQTSASRAAGVGRGSTTTSFGRSRPCSLSSIRIQSTVCVSATLWPTRKSVSHTSMSVYEPGSPSQPKLSINAHSAVAVQSRVFPSRWGVPRPARATLACA
jgi:hypothetical protein